MKKKIFFLIVIIVWLTLIPFVTLAAPPFYEGKMIRIIVGGSAGGGYDTYARVIARHMGKSIPGNPTIVVQNMTGAGTLISANHLFRAAKPDVLTIGQFSGGLFFSQVLGQPGIEFDARKFEYIGAPAKEEVVCTFPKASGITSIDKWLKKCEICLSWH